MKAAASGLRLATAAHEEELRHAQAFRGKIDVDIRDSTPDWDA